MALASLRPLRSWNFALIWSAALVSNLGSWMQTVALGVLVYARTDQPAWAGLVAAAGFVPIGLLAPVGGALADRLDRRRWLIVTTMAETTFALLLAVLAGFHHDPPWALVILSFLGGASGAIGFPAYQAMVPDLVPAEDLLGAVSLSSAQYNLGRVIGPALAGLVLLSDNYAFVFGINALSFGAVLIALLLVHLPKPAPVEGHPSMGRRILEGARAARAEPGCRSAILCIAVVALLASPFIALVPAMAKQFGGSGLSLGLVTALLVTAQGVGAVAGALALPGLALRFGRMTMLRTALFAVPVLLCGYAVSPTLAFAIPAFVAVGAAYICVLSGLNTVVQLRAPAEARGRILSIYMMALGLIYPVGAVLQGWLANAHGIRTVTVAGAVVLFAVWAVVTVVRPSIFTNLADPTPAPVDLGAPGVGGDGTGAGPVDPAPIAGRVVTGEPTVDVLTAVDAESAQARAAGALLARGCGVGDRVAFCLPSSAALLCAVLGALRIGVVPVLLNRTLTAAERDVLLDDADPTVVMTEQDELARLDTGPPAALHPHPLARPIHYTSGTTGRAKGVWTGLWDEPTAAAAVADEADLWSFGPEDVHLVCSPMYHSPSVRMAGGTLLSGGTCVVLHRFDPDLAKEALEGRYGPVPTTVFMAPTALGRLLSAPGVGRETLAVLRLLAHAGSSCPEELKRAALEMVGPDVLWEFYGSTEGQFSVCSGDEWLAHPGTVGRARVGRTLSVVDGVVWCRPPEFCRFSYWRDEVQSASAWKDGAFTVGDLGRLDEDGYLYLEGRRDDLVITGGVNVYPVEIEVSLAEVGGVAEVAVFGLADDHWGQRVCAAVVPAPGVDTGKLRAELVAHAAHHLAGYKRPKQFEFVEDLPRTGTGKVQRLRLPEVLGLG